jgi:hypothetical protein
MSLIYNITPARESKQNGRLFILVGARIER